MHIGHSRLVPTFRIPTRLHVSDTRILSRRGPVEHCRCGLALPGRSSCRGCSVGNIRSRRTGTIGVRRRASFSFSNREHQIMIVLTRFDHKRMRSVFRRGLGSEDRNPRTALQFQASGHELTVAVRGHDVCILYHMPCELPPARFATPFELLKRAPGRGVGGRFPDVGGRQDHHPRRSLLCFQPGTGIPGD